jgi:hypothetical protein
VLRLTAVTQLARTTLGAPATWRSGYAAACKAVYTGSIPVVASDQSAYTCRGPQGATVTLAAEGQGYTAPTARL